MNETPNNKPTPEPYHVMRDEQQAHQIEFRRPKEQCCFPLAALSRIHYAAALERITLSFFAERVTIEGRRLDRLYQELVAGRVKWVAEQGEKVEAVAVANATTVRRITIGRRLADTLASGANETAPKGSEETGGN
ncbi:MAG: hypothetical protein M3Z64_09655 [Verrucomicrobiota bacterium]|nr:hypothetical protein [Verrucomicrobiota bacterium]